MYKILSKKFVMNERLNKSISLMSLPIKGSKKSTKKKKKCEDIL